MSTDYTGSALQERHCKRVFRGPKMAVACLHTDTGLSGLSVGAATDGREMKARQESGRRVQETLGRRATASQRVRNGLQFDEEKK